MKLKKTGFSRAPISALLNEEIEASTGLPVREQFLLGMSQGRGYARANATNELAPPLAAVDFNLELMANVAESVPRLNVIEHAIHAVASTAPETNNAISTAPELAVIGNVISTSPNSTGPMGNVLGSNNIESFTVPATAVIQPRAQMAAETIYPRPAFRQPRVSFPEIYNAHKAHGFDAARIALPGPRKHRKVRQVRSTGNRAVTSTYCHICNRCEKHGEKHVSCGNFVHQMCGKSICTKCFAKVWWPGKVDLATARAQGQRWSCPHCCGVCAHVKGRTTTCVYYGRTSAKRRKQNVLEGDIYKHRKCGRQGDDGTA